MHSNALWTTAIVVGALTLNFAAAKKPSPPPAPASLASSISTPIVLDGKPFPQVKRYLPPETKALRTFYVAPIKANGDGSEKSPWNDLQAALQALMPGDQLRVRHGAYKKNYAIGVD